MKLIKQDIFKKRERDRFKICLNLQTDVEKISLEVYFMGISDESSEKKRRSALIGEFLKDKPIKDDKDIYDHVK